MIADLVVVMGVLVLLGGLWLVWPPMSVTAAGLLVILLGVSLSQSTED